MKQVFRFSDVLVCILCFLIFGSDASAKNMEDEGVLLFQNKEYQKALDIWYGMVQSGNVGASIYYNIGIAESSLGKTPEAVLAFEKALRFKPSDKKINVALARERKKIEGGVIPVQTFFLSRWIHSVLSFLRPGYWAMAGLILFLLLIIRKTMNKQSSLEKRATESRQAMLLLVIGILFIVCAWLAYRQIYRTDEAVVMTQCIFRQAPSDDSPELRSINPGEKVMLSDRIGDWYQVRLLNLDQGWVKSECLKFILIDGGKAAKG